MSWPASQARPSSSVSALGAPSGLRSARLPSAPSSSPTSAASDGRPGGTTIASRPVAGSLRPNVYPIAPRRGSPSGLLKDLQRPFAGDLFWAVVEELGVDRVLLVAGKDWWWEVRDVLGLRDLRSGSVPVIGSGQVRGVSIVATYHPGARIRGLTRDVFASAAALATRRSTRDG